MGKLPTTKFLAKKLKYTPWKGCDLKINKLLKINCKTIIEIKALKKFKPYFF